MANELITIVGGTSQPTNPSNNTIWINTSTNITSWIISANEPASPIEGMVWIMHWKSTDKILTLSKSLIINIGGAKQYISNAWVIVGGGVYTNNSWTNLRTYMYHEGIFNPAWSWGEPTNPAMFVEESDHLTFNGNSSNRCYLKCLDRIDLTDVNVINFDYGNRRGGDAAWTTFGLTISYMNDSDYTTLYTEAVYTYTWTGQAAATERHVVSIDVSSIKGKYYISLIDYAGADVPGGGSMYVYGIELA